MARRRRERLPRQRGDAVDLADIHAPDTVALRRGEIERANPGHGNFAAFTLG